MTAAESLLGLHQPVRQAPERTQRIAGHVVALQGIAAFHKAADGLRKSIDGKGLRIRTHREHVVQPQTCRGGGTQLPLWSVRWLHNC